MPIQQQDGVGSEPPGERGSVSMELVLLAPALVLLVLFVLWAGRGGRAGLVADLAAGEAAVVASLCCEDDPSAEDRREQVVFDVLAARPGLDFLCVHGIEGAAQGGEYVDEAWLQNFEPEVEGAARGVGAIGVRFECETDGAVAPLRGLFPNVSFYGQATEVIAIPPQPVLSLEDPWVEEDDKGATNEMEVLFELSGPVSQDVTVCYNTKNSGTGPGHAKSTDYTAVPASPPTPPTVCTQTEKSTSIPAYSVSTTGKVTIAPDDLYEGDETFELEWRIVPTDPCKANAPVLKNPKSNTATFECTPNDPDYGKPVDPNTGVVILPENLDYWKATPATGTIEDNDPKPTPTVRPASAIEGSDVVFDVALNAATGLAVELSYETKSTGTGATHATDDSSGCTVGSSGNCDYESHSHSDSPPFFTIAANETSAPSTTVPVPTGNDSVGEGDETFKLEVRVTNGNAQQATNPGTGTIVDDEPKISINDVLIATGDENANSAITFTVTLHAAYTSTVTVDWATTSYGSELAGHDVATGGSSCSNSPKPDYESASGTLTFPANTTSQTIAVAICDDDRDEPTDERFGVRLSGESSNSSILDGFGMGRINDDDAPPSVSVSVSPASVEEGDPMEFKVELDAVSENTVQVTYAVNDGTGSCPSQCPASFTGGDYSIDAPHSRTGTVVFAKGVTEEIITVQALNDNIALESDEELEVTLSAPVVNATINQSAKTATGTITDYRPNRISIDDVSALEGQALVFTVTVARAPSFTQAVTVDYVTADRTATAGDDYTAVSGTATIPAGATSATITVSALTDAVNEVAGETFFVNLSNPTPATLVAFSDSTGVGTIRNVISRDLCINNAATVTEGQQLVFEVILGEYDTNTLTCSEKSSTETVTVNWSTRNGTGNTGAVAPGDYVATTNATLTFNPGETKKTLSVQTNNDLQLTEGTEKLFVDLVANSAQNAVIRDHTGEGEIDNIAPAEITVDDPQAEEGDDLVFTVTVANPPSTGDVTVDYEVRGLTATGPGSATGDDFDMKSPTGATGQLTITAPNTTATVTLSTESGDAYEPDETVRLDLSNSSANALINDATGIGTIEQECVDPTNSSHTPPALGFRTGRLTGLTQTLGTADEGVQIPFAVTIDAPFCSGGGYFMLRASGGTATSGTDYTAPAAATGYKIGDVSSPTPLNNELQTTVYITTTDDQIDEPDETFTLEVNWLDTGTNAMAAHYLTGISWVSTTGTITDNDALPNVSVADAAAGEGNNVVFTVTMDRVSSQNVVLDYNTSDCTTTNCATAGTDYTRTSSQLAGPVTIAAGAVSTTVSVPTTVDTITETQETFDFTLSWPSSQTTPYPANLADPNAVGTIVDTLLPVMTISDVTVLEDAGNAVFTVSLDQPSSSNVTVNYSTAALGTGDTAATGGASGCTACDYETATNTTLTIAAGSTQGTISIPINDDTDVEKSETFQVQLTSPSGAVLADRVGVGTIIDNDTDCIDATDTNDSPPTVTVPNASTVESANNLSFTVTLSKPFCADAAFEVETLDGTATAGADYVAWSDTSVSVPAYYTQLVWGIQVLPDDLVEVDEDFYLNIDWANSMGSRYTALPRVQATGTITDDDGELKVSVNDPAKVKEGSTVDFVISLDKVGGRAVTVDYATSDCTTPNCATAGSDYTAVSGTATIPAGNLSAVVSVQTLTDTDYSEADETFQFVLSDPVGAQLDDSTGVGTIENADEPEISVSDATADEGTRMFFTVSLDKAGTAVVSVDYATSDCSTPNCATAGSDYAAVSGTLVFSPGETSKSVQVSIAADGISEADETFQLVLSNPANASLADAIGVGTITDVAAPRIRVSDLTVTEGGTLSFEVALDKAATWDVVVPFATKDGTATQPGDYTATANTVTIAVGDTTANVPVVTIDDALDENAETMRLELSATSDGVLADPIAVGTLFDNDGLPSVALTATRVTGEEADSNDNAGSVSFTVQLSEVSGRAVTVDYATDDITAISNATCSGPNPPNPCVADYTDTDGTLTIAAGTTSGQVTVPLLNDTEDESAEAFRFTLSNPSNATLGSPATAQAVIIDDDTATPSVLLRNHTPATEGNPATVEVYLDRPNETDVVSLYYSTSDCVGDGCATAGTDYTAASNALISFPLRDQTHTISIPTADDTEAEGDETFTVTLSGATNANLVDQNATLTILDDDGDPSVSIGDASATEGSSLSFTVRLSFAAKDTVTVNYDARVDDTAGDDAAVLGQDFVPTSGTLTFNAGDTAKTVTVPTYQDVFDEADETFWVQLTSASGATLRDSTATGTILDDDPLPSLSVGDASAAEGDAATFTVTLSAASGRDVTATYATAEHSTGQDPATSGTDYTAAPGTLRITAGDTSATVTVSTIEDTDAEQDETFLVKLDNPANAQIADNTGVGTIIDDDGQSRLSVADVTLFEDEGPAQFAVTLSHSSSKEITVGYRTANGTATQPADYTFTSGTLTIAANDNSGTISVPIINDIAEENDETFTLELVSPKNATILDQEATATIRDDDGEPRISVADVEALENVTGGTLDFEVTLSHAADEDITVQYATFDRTATQPFDYAATTGTLTIPAGDTTATIKVTIIDDNVAEGTPTWVPFVCPPENRDEDWCKRWEDRGINVYRNVGGETLLLRLDSPTEAIIDDGEATGTITDDENLPTVGSVNWDAEANEDDGEIVLWPTLSHPSVHTITASYAFGSIYDAPQDIHRSDDPAFVNTPGEAVFAPGATSAPIRVKLNDNGYTTTGNNPTRYYMNAHFGVQIISVENGFPGITAYATIWDDESPPFVSGFAGQDVEESAGQAVFTLHLNRSSDEDSVVGYRVSTSRTTATAGEDYTSVDSTVTFAAGTNTATVSVPIINDTIAESSEVLALEVYSHTSNENINLSALTAQQYAEISIIDDDSDPKLSISDSQADETSGTITFIVSLDKASSKDITVDYATADGTATAGDDYTAASGTLTITAGDTTAAISVTILADEETESRENFTITLSNANNAEIEDSQATGYIFDGDGLPGVTFYHSPYNEGGHQYGRLSFRVGFSESSLTGGSVEFRLVEDQSLGFHAATPDVDWNTTPSHVFATDLGGGWYRIGVPADGMTSQNNYWIVYDDLVPEFDERIKVELRNPVNLKLEANSFYLTITDDDLPIVTIDDVTVSESASSAVITLSLHDEGVEAAKVSYRTKVLTTADHSASPGDDFTQTEGILDIAVGTTTATITVPLLGDTTDEFDEKFVLELYNADKLEVNDTIAVITITDDDDGWQITDDSEAEGTTLSFTVTRDNSTSALTLNYTIQADAANSATGGTHCSTGVDYITPSGTLDFAAGVATGTISINTCDDTVFEGTEIFLVNLSDVTGRKTTATATITDND